MFYRFIKITNNNNHNNFYIDFTQMTDPRIRISILNSRYKDYLAGIGDYKPIYEVLQTDFSFYCIHRQNCKNLNEVKEVKKELEELYRKKLVDYKPKETSDVICFQ